MGLAQQGPEALSPYKDIFTTSARRRLNAGGWCDRLLGSNFRLPSCLCSHGGFALRRTGTGGLRADLAPIRRIRDGGATATRPGGIPCYQAVVEVNVQGASLWRSLRRVAIVRGGVGHYCRRSATGPAESRLGMTLRQGVIGAGCLSRVVSVSALRAPVGHVNNNVNTGKRLKETAVVLC